MKYVVCVQVDVPTMVRLLRKLGALPRQPSFVGGAIAVQVPAALADAKQRFAVGWTTRLVVPIKHPTLQQWAFAVTKKVRDFWAANRSNLTAAERTWLTSRLASEADLDASWGSALEDDILRENDP